MGAVEWPEELTRLGLTPEHIDAGALPLLLLQDYQPFLLESGWGASPLAALRAGFVLGVLAGRDELPFPKRTHTRAEPWP